MPTYNATTIAGLDATTPTTGTWTVPEVDDAIREIKTAIKADLLVKRIEIGDWNMDATAAVTVAHGLTLTKIRSVSALIRSDSDTAYHQLPVFDSSSPYYPIAQITSIAATYITLSRLTGYAFDSTSYDSTSFNRGWITIFYVE